MTEDEAHYFKKGDLVTYANGAGDGPYLSNDGSMDIAIVVKIFEREIVDFDTRHSETIWCVRIAFLSDNHQISYNRFDQLFLLQRGKK